MRSVGIAQNCPTEGWGRQTRGRKILYGEAIFILLFGISYGVFIAHKIAIVVHRMLFTEKA